MKKVLAVLLLAVGVSLPATADVLFTWRIHVDPFYHEGVQRPERTDTVDIWIAPGRMACRASSFKIIVDAGRDLLILVNDGAKTYAQATLSEPVVASMRPDDREAMPIHEIKARVRQTGETRIVLGRICQGYAIVLRSNLDHEVAAWATADIPLDMAAYRALLKKLQACLGRYDADSIEALLGLQGYILSQENVADLKGETLRVRRDVIAISEKTPPEGLFSVPAGYTKKAGLTHEDVDLVASIWE